MVDTSLDCLYSAWLIQQTDLALADLLVAVRRIAKRAGYEFRDAAEDFAQNVSFTVWQNIASFKQTTSDGFSRWLRVIMRNERMKRYEDEQHISSFGMTEQAIDDHEFIDIADLPREIREVAVSLLSGYSLKETALRMNIKEGTLRKRLHSFRTGNETPCESAYISRGQNTVFDVSRLAIGRR